MSYQMRIDRRSQKAGRFIAKVHKELQGAFVESGLRQQELASKLGVDRSFVNRRLLGEGNLTLRSIADFAWALNKDIQFKLVSPEKRSQSNYFDETRIRTNNEVRCPKQLVPSTSSSIQKAELVDA